MMQISQISFYKNLKRDGVKQPGGSNCVTSAKEMNEIEGFEASIFPNPASPMLQDKHQNGT